MEISYEKWFEIHTQITTEKLTFSSKIHPVFQQTHMAHIQDQAHEIFNTKQGFKYQFHPSYINNTSINSYNFNSHKHATQNTSNSVKTQILKFHKLKPISITHFTIAQNQTSYHHFLISLVWGLVGLP